MKLNKQPLDILRSRAGLAIIIIAAVLVGVTSIVQYLFAKDSIQKEVKRRSESELRVKSLEIKNVMSVVEVAVDNMAWAVEQRLSQPDSLLAITQKLLADNEYIVGSAIAFEPYYYQEKGRQFSPYTYKHDGIMTSKQLGTDQYDYHTMEWYTAPMESGHSHWSEPYFDEGGGNIIMSTYSRPIKNAAGRTVAIFTADVSLDWLSEVINARPIYPSSYNLIISRTGQIMACPVESLIMRKNISEMIAETKDTTISNIRNQMLAGQSGQAVVRDNKGEKRYVFYAQMDNETGWSMAVVCSDREIYSELRHVSIILYSLMLIGLGLLGFIIWRTARNAASLQAINAEKERIGRDLHIASEIQKGMLPKNYPPFPDRDDVEIFGSLIPAREVGGDLFDFFIRDEKLFFCIGDVSGKGVPASLVMAVTRSLFRSASAYESNPDRIVTHMNNSMAQINDTNMFVTLFLGVLDLPKGRLRYCNAGHCSPVLVSDKAEQIPIIPNLPLALMQGWRFEGQEMQIQPQTTIFLYTDGLTEAENTVCKLYGEDRMMNELSQMSQKDKLAPQAIIDRIVSSVHSFADGAMQSDDLTMLAIKYTRAELDVRLSRILELDNDVEQVPLLSTWVEEVCEAVGFDVSTAMQLNLAVEEAVVNVFKYAYPLGIKGKVLIEAVANDARLKFIITDNGEPFDPTSKAEVDTLLSADERPIGGLGIHLVRKIMDSINYERVNGRNVLTLRKKLK